MPEVPVGIRWPRVAFGEVVRLTHQHSANPQQDGHERFVGLDDIDPGDLTIRRWGSVANGTTFTNVFRPGNVLFAKRRAYQRKVAVPNFGGVCSGDIYVMEPVDDRLLPELLPFICQTDQFIDHAVGTSAGSLSPRTNWTSLSHYGFALPPLDDQRRLVDALRAVEKLSEGILKVRSAVENIRRSMMDALVPPPHGRSSAAMSTFASLDIDQLRVRPGETYRIAGVYSFGRGLLSRGSIGSSDTKYELLQRLRHNQVVVSKLKAWEGATALVTAEFEGSYASPEFPTFTLDERALAPAYMDLVCRSPWFWSELASHSKGTAERRSRLYPSDFLGVEIHVPTLEHQLRAVERLRILAEAMGAIEIRTASIHAVKRQLLGVLVAGSDPAGTL